MKHKLLIATFLAAFSTALKAQVTVSGSITSEKGSPIANANISIKDSYDGATSDRNGEFSFNSSESGKVMLLISAANYFADSLKVDLANIPAKLIIKLKSQHKELDVVSISAGTFEASDTKKGVVLNSLDVATTAGATADVFAALQTLPGTQPSFSESGLFVRGGSAAETKTYFDGMLVKNPFNSQVPDQASRGRFSPFLFKGTSFSSGGYSAQYGQALSSALVLESKDLPEKTTTGLSFLSVGTGIDQNIRYKKSALSLGGFYYNLKPAFSIIKQNTNWQKEPEQYGGTIQYKLKTSNTGMFKWYSDFSNTALQMFKPDLERPGTNSFFSNSNQNSYINSTWQDYLGSKWKFQSGVSYSNTGNKGLIATDKYKRNDEVLQGRTSATWFYNKLSSLKFGGETYRISRRESMNGLSRDYTDHLQTAFAESEIFITPRLAARLGLRSEYSSYIDKINLAPRTSLGYKLDKRSQVSLAYGKFYQNPEDEYLIMQPLDYEQAQHYIANYQYTSANYTFRVEGFYKDYNKLAKNENGALSNSGDGYAKGVDVFWRDKKTVKDVDYWISYSFLDSKRNFSNYPNRAVPPFAARHTFNVVYKQFFDKLDTHVGATYTFATGRSYFNPNNQNFMGDRTKNLNNFSVNISYLTHVFKQFTVLYISANNVFGIKNVYGYNYSTDGRFRQAITPPAPRDLFVGLLLTIGDDTFVR